MSTSSTPASASACTSSLSTSSSTSHSSINCQSIHPTNINIEQMNEQTLDASTSSAPQSTQSNSNSSSNTDLNTSTNHLQVPSSNFPSTSQSTQHATSTVPSYPSTSVRFPILTVPPATHSPLFSSPPESHFYHSLHAFEEAFERSKERANMEYTCIETQREYANQKMAQLKSIANLAALLAGFATIFVSEVKVPDTVDEIVGGHVMLALFAGFAGVVIALNMLCLMICSLIVVTVQNFDCGTAVHDVFRSLPEEVLPHVVHDRLEGAKGSFHQFWITRCEADWLFAYKCFILSVPLFLIDVAFLGFVQFNNSIISAIVIATCVGICMLFIVLHILPNWSQSVFPPKSTSELYKLYASRPSTINKENNIGLDESELPMIEEEKINPTSPANSAVTNGISTATNS